LGFEPLLRLDGPLDDTVNEDIARHLLAALREALSNAIRHAQATRVEVTIAVADGEVVAEVRDNGVGPGPADRPGGHGLANLMQRATSHGGTVSIAAGPDGRGSVLTWRVPLSRGGQASKAG
jgi:signal transduction histidine kinase